MKRMLMTAIASLTLVFAAPGMALAHQGKHHRGAHHAAGHRRHGKQAHLVTFTATPGATTGTSSTPPATSPTEESAGTVTTFSNGTLTITLTDKTVVSGKFEGTELTCTPPATTTGGDDEGGGDDQDSSDGAGHGDSSAGAQPMSQQHDDFQGQENRGDGWDENEQAGQEGCTTALLVPGAVVRTAELRMSGAGAVWEKVELVH
jgi:hypothetical protein